MQQLLERQFTWGGFLLIALSLILLYFLLKYTKRVLSKSWFTSRYQKRAERILHYALLAYEPLAFLILGSVFVMINPVFHGVLLLLLLLGGFGHVKNYFSGRIIQFDRSVMPGKRMKVQNDDGIIYNMGRLGMRLKTNKGIQYINYSKLITEGYLLSAGEEIGGFYHLKIRPEENNSHQNHMLYLMDRLAAAPYLDRRHKPQIIHSKKESEEMSVRIIVKEKEHLRDLIHLINEWGYLCEIV